MLINAITSLMPIAVLAVALPNLFGQEIVHAMAGTLTRIDPAGGSLTLKLPDQSTETFELKTVLSAQISFDKTLREESVTPSELPHGDTNAIVYYFGLSPLIAVAVKDLGKGAATITGTVARADKAKRSIETKTAKGGENTCYLTKDTTVETSSGAVDGTRYSPQSGERVSMICTEKGGREEAEFVQSLNY
jgi:hypothetical protein